MLYLFSHTYLSHQIFRFNHIQISRLILYTMFPVLLYIYYSDASLISDKIGCCHQYGFGTNMNLCCHKFTSINRPDCNDHHYDRNDDRIIGGHKTWYDISCLGLEKLVKLHKFI